METTIKELVLVENMKIFFEHCECEIEKSVEYVNQLQHALNTNQEQKEEVEIEEKMEKMEKVEKDEKDEKELEKKDTTTPKVPIVENEFRFVPCIAPPILLPPGQLPSSFAEDVVCPDEKEEQNEETQKEENGENEMETEKGKEKEKENEKEKEYHLIMIGFLTLRGPPTFAFKTYRCYPTFPKTSDDKILFTEKNVKHLADEFYRSKMGPVVGQQIAELMVSQASEKFVAERKRCYHDDWKAFSQVSSLLTHWGVDARSATICLNHARYLDNGAMTYKYFFGQCDDSISGYARTISSDPNVLLVTPLDHNGVEYGPIDEFFWILRTHEERKQS